MSVNQLHHQLQQDLQNELTVTNQLIYQISKELKTIKEFTSPGGKLESNIVTNATSMDTLRSYLSNNVDLANISILREANDTQQNNDQNMSYYEDTLRNSNNDSQ